MVNEIGKLSKKRLEIVVSGEKFIYYFFRKPYH